MAVYLTFKNLFEAAFFMVLLGTFFDLFDGFFARILKVDSDFGMQLDSMADLITSGLVPGVVMYELFLKIGIREVIFEFPFLFNNITFSIAPPALIGFLIPLAAAIRLSNFNIDTEQAYEFKGLPAPANALFIVALPQLIAHPLFQNFKPYLFSFSGLVFITFLSVFLMNVRLRLFSFKITAPTLFAYTYQFILIFSSIPLFYFFQWVAVPLLIVLYLFLNVIRNRWG